MTNGQMLTTCQVKSLCGGELPDSPHLSWDDVQGFRREGDVLVPYTDGKRTSHPRICVAYSTPSYVPPHPVTRDELLAWVVTQEAKNKNARPEKAQITEACANV